MRLMFGTFVLLLGASCSAAREPAVLSSPDPADPSAAATPVSPLPPLHEGSEVGAQPAEPAAEDHSGHHAAPATHQHPEPEEAVVYTCPMHPDVRQAEPGTCSICGMNLTPVRKPPLQTP